MLNKFKKMLIGSEKSEPISTVEKEIETENYEKSELDKLNYKIYIDVACNLNFFIDEETNSIYYSYDDSYRDCKASLYKFDDNSKVLTIKYSFKSMDSDVTCNVYYESEYLDFNFEKLKIIDNDKLKSIYKSITDEGLKSRLKILINRKIVISPSSIFDEGIQYQSFIVVNKKYYIKCEYDFDGSLYGEKYKYEVYDIENIKFYDTLDDLGFLLFINDNSVINTKEFISIEEFNEVIYPIKEAHSIYNINKDNETYISWVESILEQHLKINMYLEKNGILKLMPINDIDSLMKFLSVMPRYDFIKGVEIYYYDNFKENFEFLYVAETYLKNIKGV